MTAAELAAELEVSQRTVLRDIDELSGAGVPVYALRGRRGGFELLGGYDAGLASPDSWRTPGPRRRRIGVRVSPEGQRTAALLGRPLRLRRVRRWDPAPGREHWSEATLVVDSLDDASLTLLQLGAEVEVVTPAELRETMVRVTTTLAEMYSAS